MTEMHFSVPNWILVSALAVAAAHVITQLRLAMWSRRLVEKQKQKIAELEARLRQARIRLVEFGVYTLTDETEDT